MLAAGGTAVFVTDNGTGSAALVSIGAALLLAAGLWDRLESFEFAGAKMQMRIDAVAEARAAARRKRHEPAEVRHLFERGTDGERMYALGLMQEDERLRDFAVSLEAIEHSRSAFEQYYALSLAELMLPALTKDQRRQLEAMLTKLPGNAAYIRPGTDRWIVAEQILSRLRSA